MQELFLIIFWLSGGMFQLKPNPARIVRFENAISQIKRIVSARRAFDRPMRSRFLPES